MALHLITGYAGEEHITSADQGAYNMGTFGDGEFVLDRGNKFEATVVSNNLITIADGEALMQGRFIKMIMGTSEEVTIENGSQGMNRKDLICIRYEKNSSTGIETASFVVKKGTESSSTPADPAYTTGDITDGQDLVNEMPLYRINLEGLNITSIDTLFSVKVSMVDYMDNYQLPVASGSNLGGVKVWPYSRDGLKVEDSFLKMNIPTSANTYGVCGMNYQEQSNKDGLYFDSTGRPRIHQAYISGGIYLPINNDGTFSVPAGVSKIMNDDIKIKKTNGLEYILHLSGNPTNAEINAELERCFLTSLSFMDISGNILPLIALSITPKISFDGTNFNLGTFFVWNPTNETKTIGRVGFNVVNLFHRNQ